MLSTLEFVRIERILKPWITSISVCSAIKLGPFTLKPGSHDSISIRAKQKTKQRNQVKLAT